VIGRRLWVVIVALTIMLGHEAAAARATATVLGRGSPTEHVSAFDGRVVWNTRVRGGYVLMTRHAGLTRRVAVPRRRLRGYDVDVGPGPAGRPVAVYSRCQSESQLRGCDLYLYDFARRRERRLAGPSRTDQILRFPSIWRGNVAYVRGVGPPAGPYNRFEPPRIVFSALSGRRARSYAGGSRARAAESGLDPDLEDVADVQLRGTRLAFSWRFEPAVCPLGSETRTDSFTVATELWTIDVGRQREVVARGCSGEPLLPGGVIDLGPGTLSFPFTRRGVLAPGSSRLDSRIGELNVSNGRLLSSNLPVMGNFARDGNYTYRYSEGRLVRDRLRYLPPES